MSNVLYTAEAHVTGGRGQGHGRTSDGQLDVQLRLPKEMGGAGDGTNPEQLFAVGYAACFEGALGVVGRRAKVEVEDAAIDSKVTLTPNGSGGFQLGVALDVSLPSVEDRRARRRARAQRPRGLPVFERDARQHRGRADGERAAGPVVRETRSHAARLKSRLSFLRPLQPPSTPAPDICADPVGRHCPA